MTPSVLLVISTPMKRFFSHLPAWVEASACGICRASASIRVIACSAVVIEFPNGVFITMTPLAVAAGISTLSTPMPARPMTFRVFAFSRILEKAKTLKVIGRAGIGVDNVDIPAATAKGVIVMNTPFGNSITTAEHAITLMLALARQIPQADASTQAGKWEKNRFMGVEITGKTLGVIGCGNIGSIVANRAIGLKMKVIAYDPYLSPERALDLGVERVEL